MECFPILDDLYVVPDVNNQPGFLFFFLLSSTVQNLAFFGTSCPEGSCSAVVVRIADNTLMGQIAGLAMSTDNEQTPINREIEHFIKVTSNLVTRTAQAMISSCLTLLGGWVRT